MVRDTSLVEVLVGGGDSADGSVGGGAGGEGGGVGGLAPSFLGRSGFPLTILASSQQQRL